MKAFAAILATAAVAATGASTSPNIVFLCMDDLKPELGCYGSSVVKTPNIDRLATRGTLFKHHYVQQAVCAPSRASMFTGLRPDTTRVWDLQHTCREECPQAFTMQQFFKEHGYVTAGSGKVMHGFKDGDPQSWSIPFVEPESLTYPNGHAPALYSEYQSEAVQAVFAVLKTNGIQGYGPQQKFMAEHNAKPATECLDLPDNAYSDGAMTDWAISMLDGFAKNKKPFFLTLGYRKPHLPFVAPKKYWDIYERQTIKLAAFRSHAKDSPEYAYQPGWELGGYSGVDLKTLNQDEAKQRELIHGYYASVSFVDAQIGRVLVELERTGLATNTIIVLWGDNGWHLGDHSIWCKHSNFEQATHTPLIISAPGLAKAATCSAPVESVDIFPTLCALADLPTPKQLQGKSLIPVLQNPEAKLNKFAMSQYPDHQQRGLMGYALRDERYRFVIWVKNEVAKSRKYNQAATDAVELYDYLSDPLEKVNLANDPKYKDVAAKFEHLFKAQGGASRSAGPGIKSTK